MEFPPYGINPARQNLLRLFHGKDAGGWVLYPLNRRRYKTYTVDKDPNEKPTIVGNAIALSGARAVLTQLPEEGFSVICMTICKCCTLGQMKRTGLRNFFRRIYELLKPDGVLMIEDTHGILRESITGKYNERNTLPTYIHPGLRHLAGASRRQLRTELFVKNRSGRDIHGYVHDRRAR